MIASADFKKWRRWRIGSNHSKDEVLRLSRQRNTRADKPRPATKLAVPRVSAKEPTTEEMLDKDGKKVLPGQTGAIIVPWTEEYPLADFTKLFGNGHRTS